MKKENISFEVKMTVKELYRFLLYHAYHKVAGVLGILISIVAIVALIVGWENMTETTRAACIIIPVFLLVVDPLRFWNRARVQVKRNKVYKNALKYEVNAQGIVLYLGEQSQNVQWNQFMKIVETKNQFLLYTTPIMASIVPKASLGDDVEAFAEMIKTYTENTNVKLVGRLKEK